MAQGTQTGAGPEEVRRSAWPQHCQLHLSELNHELTILASMTASSQLHPTLIQSP